MRYLGGQAVQAQRLLQGLRKLGGLQVRYLEVDPLLPMPFRAMQRVPILRTLVTSVAYTFALLRAVPRSDTVHIFSASYWSFLIAPVPALLIGRMFGKRVLLNYHSGEADDHLTRWGWHVKPLLRLADLLIVPTQYLVDVFGRHGFAAVPIANHIDVGEMMVRDRQKMVPRFFSNRNHEAHYNVGAIVAAFAVVKRTFPAAELVIAGDGSLRRALEAKVAELELTDVTFTGPVAPARMPALYAAADVYVNASLIDNMPLSLLEAYGAGVPVVTSDAGGIPWIATDGATASIVPAGDVAALAAAMIDSVTDPASAWRRADQAREFVMARFAWDVVSGQWAAAYTGTDAAVVSRTEEG